MSSIVIYIDVLLLREGFPTAAKRANFDETSCLGSRNHGVDPGRGTHLGFRVSELQGFC